MRTKFILHICILITLLCTVRCNDDDNDDDNDEVAEEELGDLTNDNVYDDYDPPTKTYATDPKIISRNVKCLVCRETVREMQLAINKIDPRKKVEVSGFRMDPSGNSDVRSVQYSKSETYLTELMDDVCTKMDDYAKARMKDTRELIVIKLIDESGGMNPLMSAVDFVQDGDLNKSLQHFCLEVLEDHEESFLKQFMEEITPPNIAYTICTKIANYCDEEPEDDTKHDTSSANHEEL